MTDSKHRLVLQLTCRGRTETESWAWRQGYYTANLVRGNNRLLVVNACLFPFHLIFIVTMFLFSQANLILSHAFRIEFFRFMTQKLSNGCDIRASSYKSPQLFSIPETPEPTRVSLGLNPKVSGPHSLQKKHLYHLQERTIHGHNLPSFLCPPPPGQPTVSVDTPRPKSPFINPFRA